MAALIAPASVAVSATASGAAAGSASAAGVATGAVAPVAVLLPWPRRCRMRLRAAQDVLGRCAADTPVRQYRAGLRVVDPASRR
jgi:hypothetical protein